MPKRSHSAYRSFSPSTRRFHPKLSLSSFEDRRCKAAVPSMQQRSTQSRPEPILNLGAEGSIKRTFGVCKRSLLCIYGKVIPAAEERYAKVAWVLPALKSKPFTHNLVGII